MNERVIVKTHFFGAWANFFQKALRVAQNFHNRVSLR
jgi:hypothetical protein